jgi:hypothetical protein
VNHPGAHSRDTRWPAVAVSILVAVFIGCDRNDQARKSGPATQPATQPAGDARPAEGGAGAGATPAVPPAPEGAPPGAAPPGAASPGASSPAAAARDPGTRPASPQAGRPGETFVVEENPDLKGRFGRLLVQFPEGSKAEANIRLFKAGEETEVQSTYHKFSADLLPGTYDVEVASMRVNGVEVKPRHNTRVRVGALKMSADKSTNLKVRGADGTVAFNGYGDSTVGLPIGKYTVEVSGQSEEVAVKDGEVAEF